MAQTAQILADVYKDLTARIKPSGPPIDSKSFICASDLREVWQSSNRFLLVFQPLNLDSNQLQHIWDRLLATLSCLVFICASGAIYHNTFNDVIANALFALWREQAEDELLPLLEEQLQSLPFETIRTSFLKTQYIFKPYTIRITPDITRIEVDFRLPFEKVDKNIGVGGYGKVDRVGIAPGYYQNKRGLSNDRILWFACKRIKNAEHFKKEVGNVTLLRSSITTCQNIMLHVTAIEKGPKGYILLPLAEFGDLEQLLNQLPRPNQADATYQYAEYLPDLANPNADITVPLMVQLYNIAAALKWLHHGIELDDGSGHMRLIHEDLKPSNILICRSDDSQVEQHGNSSRTRQLGVGKWMISDFGISSLKDDPSPRSRKRIVTVKEYFDIASDMDAKIERNSNTRHTAPQREGGTYQAPEVEQYHIHEAGETTLHFKGIGRRSDVWSFGCISAEVLAFAIGRQNEVATLRALRTGVSGSDYFYEEGEMERRNLDVPSPSNKTYRVRRSVTRWLDATRQNPSLQQWVKCFVEHIKRILIGNPNARPSTEDLVDYIEHVRNHVKASKNNDLFQCEVLEEAGYNVDTTFTNRGSTGKGKGRSHLDYIPSNNTDTNYINQDYTGKGKGRSDSMQDRYSPSEFESATSGFDPFKFPPLSQRFEDQIPIRTRRPRIPTVPPITVSEPGEWTDPGDPPFPPNERQKKRPGSGSTGTPKRDSQLSPTSEKASTTSSPRRHGSYARPDNFHGLKIQPDIQREVSTSRIEALRKRDSTRIKPTAFAINALGYKIAVAHLAENTVFLFEFDSEADGWQHKLFEEIPLPIAKWTGIAVGGDYVAIWGLSGPRKALFVCDRREPKKDIALQRDSKAIFSKVAISQLGLIALLGDNIICVFNLGDGSSAGGLYSLKGQHFTDISFNDTGNHLFAWAYGREKDSLYVWRCDQRLPIRDAEAIIPYSPNKENAPATKLWPYNTYVGTIVETHGKYFFAAQIRGSSLEDTKQVIRSKDVGCMLKSVLVARVYHNHSLLTVEGHLTGSAQLKEHQISYSSTHVLQKQGEKVYKLHSRVSKNSQIQFIHDGDNILVVIYNLDGSAEWIKFEPV